jgi:hypothetical protein
MRFFPMSAAGSTAGGKCTYRMTLRVQVQGFTFRVKASGSGFRVYNLGFKV